MIQPITLVTAGIFFAVLFLRYRSRPQNGPPRTKQQRLKAAKLLLAALAAWMTIHYSLRHSIAKMDGVDQQPSLVERVISFFSK
jgi:hypothetical protein